MELNNLNEDNNQIKDRQIDRKYSTFDPASLTHE